MLRSDQCLSTAVRHPFRSETRGSETRGFQPLGSRRNHQRLLEHKVFRTYRLPAHVPSRNRCLPSFAARGRMTADVLDDGRRRAVDREQFGTMNNPMHRRPRRRPRKWNTHRRGPGGLFIGSSWPRSTAHRRPSSSTTAVILPREAKFGKHPFRDGTRAGNLNARKTLCSRRCRWLRRDPRGWKPRVLRARGFRSPGFGFRSSRLRVCDSE